MAPALTAGSFPAPGSSPLGPAAESGGEQKGTGRGALGLLIEMFSLFQTELSWINGSGVIVCVHI